MRDEARIEREKRLAAQAAAEIPQSGMTLGLGSGSTVAYMLPALAARRLDILCVASSPAIERAARELGMRTESFAGEAAPIELDLVIDGADEVAPSGWLIKGGGAAHTREKALVAAADRFVVIVSSNKLVERLTPPIPLELLWFGLAATLARLGEARVRGVPRSPDGGVICDYLGDFFDPAALAERLSETTGVVEHGLFGPALVSEVVVGQGDEVQRFAPG